MVYEVICLKGKADREIRMRGSTSKERCFKNLGVVEQVWRIFTMRTKIQMMSNGNDGGY